jgi:hypothetical protein
VPSASTASRMRCSSVPRRVSSRSVIY